MILTPRDLLPLFYVQAESLVGLASGALIELWRDSSGRGRIGDGMTPIGGGFKPTFVDSVPTYGGPAVQFIVPGIGDADVLQIASFIHDIGAGPFTAWVLIRPVNDSTPKSIWAFATSPSVGLGIKDLKPYFSGSNIAGGAGQVGTTAMTAGAWHVMILTRTSAGLLTCYVDGTADATTPTDTGTIPTGALFLGGGTLPSINAEMRDFGLFDRLLSTTERDDLTYYLLNRITLPAPSISRALSHRIRADWDYDQDFTTLFDDISSRIDILRGITSTRGRDPSRALGEPRIPPFTAVGVNDDKFFTAGFAGSPIYQKATTGRPLEWGANVGDAWDAMAPISAMAPIYADGIETIPTYTGFIDRLTHLPNYQDRRVNIRALGVLVRLKNYENVSTTQVYTNITTGQAMAILLGLINIFGLKSRVEGTTVVLKHWWLNKENPYKAAIDLQRTEGPGAYLGEEADGTIVFEGQDYRTSNARSLTPQAVFAPSAGFLFAEPEHDDGADAIINVATYHVTERALKASAAVWTYSPTIVLGALQTRFIEFTLDDPFTALVTPLVSGTDLTISAGSLTQQTVFQQTANRATVTLIAGAGGATVTGLQVRGQSYGVVNDSDVQNSVSTTASQQVHGISSKDMTGRKEIDRNVGIAICDTTVQRYQDPRAVNRFALIGITGEYMRQALVRRPSDRISYREDQTGQNADAWIESIDLQAVDGLLVARIGAERVIAQGFGRFDSGTYDSAVYGQ